jgi:hypothetical protein
MAALESAVFSLALTLPSPGGGFAQKLLISREFLGKWPFCPKIMVEYIMIFLERGVCMLGTRGHATAKPFHHTEAKIGMFAMPR